MMKKLQKIIRRTTIISRISDIKIIQTLKKFEKIEKQFERKFCNLLTVRERSI